jgi:ketosteroid isomerase-like protein
MRDTLALLTTALLLAGCEGRREVVMPAEPVATPTPAPGGDGTAPGGEETAPRGEGTAPVGEGAAAAGVPADAAAGAAATEVAALVESWRSAWQGKDLAAYLAFYAPDFRGDGKDLAAWSAHKKGVFERSGDIEVTVSDLVVRPTADGAEAEFRQRYAGGAHADEGRKTLVLRRVEGAWRIVGERFRAGR